MLDSEADTENARRLYVSVRRLGGRATGAAVQQRLEEHFRERPSLGAIYNGLEALERDGYLRSTRREFCREGGRPARCWQLTRRCLVPAPSVRGEKYLRQWE